MWPRNAAGLAFTAAPPALAKYGEFANMPSNTDFAVGNAENECLFAQPGTGQCMVFRSSQPPIWQTADTGVALKKLIAAAESLNNLDSLSIFFSVRSNLAM